MALEVTSIPRPAWTPLPHEGCVEVEGKALLRLPHLNVAMLRFGANGTIHEHAAPIDIDVICLEGQGMTSVGGEQAPIHAGERVRWPAHQQHRLWTEGHEMITLMVEHNIPSPDRSEN